RPLTLMLLLSLRPVPAFAAGRSCSPSFSTRSAPYRDLHSFPTRRSSDLDNGKQTHVDLGCIERAGVIIFSICRRREGHGKPGEKIGRAQSELQSRFDLVCRLLLEEKNWPVGCSDATYAMTTGAGHAMGIG